LLTAYPLIALNYIMKAKNPKKNQLEAILRVLNGGGVVVAPTDTVYGLLADASQEGAVSKLLRIKGRNEKKGIPIFIPSLAYAKTIALVSSKDEAFLDHVWPGKVTAILRLRPDAALAQNTLTGDGTVGLRIPAYQLLRDLLETYKKPLTGTSANRSGLPSCLDTACIKKQLGALPDLIVEGGILPAAQASTIVDLTKEPYKIIRSGAGDEVVKGWAEKSKCQNPNVKSNPKLK